MYTVNGGAEIYTTRHGFWLGAALEKKIPAPILMSEIQEESGTYVHKNNIYYIIS